MIKYCPVFTGRRKETVLEFKIKFRRCLSLDMKAIFEVFQKKLSANVEKGNQDP